MIKHREFSEKEKTHLLKVATSITKKIKGKGPRNIYIKYLENEIHIHASGIMTNFEKYLIECAIKAGNLDDLNDCYEKECLGLLKLFNEALGDQYQFQFKGFKADHIEDQYCLRLINTKII